MTVMRVAWVCGLVACHHTAHEPSSASELFAGTKAPTLTVLHGVHWADNYAAAEVALKRHDTETLHYSTIGDRASRLSEIDVHTQGDPTSELTALWGPPKISESGAALGPPGARVWYGEHVVAMATANRLQLVHYVPLAEELGAPGTTLFGFERDRPIIGATPKQIAMQYKDELKEVSGAMVLARPDDELGAFDVELHEDHGTITSLLLMVFMEKGAQEREQTVLRRFDKTALTDEERTKGFVWRNYKVEILTNAKVVWSVNVSAQ